MNKKILVITPKFPYPVLGAYEADRAEGFKQFLRLGYDIKIIAKINESQSELVKKKAQELGVDIYPILYKFQSGSKWKKYLKILLTNPALLDGAAYEYTDPEIVNKMKEVIRNFKPEVIWFDSSYMWPLIKKAKNQKNNKTNDDGIKKIKIITRSVNVESEHFLQEKGRSLKNLIIYHAKMASEKKAARQSDVLLAITPSDRDTYKKMKAKNIKLLPLRSLPELLKDNHEIRDSQPLQVFFAGATYNVEHNRQALEFVIKQVAPQVEKLAPGKFVFNILGSKFPKDLKQYLNNRVKYLGYVEDYESAMEKMDIALIPSLAGGGMQQKIFEPLVRGIPTITSARGLAGYPYENNVHLLTAKTADDFVSSLMKIQDKGLREKISKNSIKLSQELFKQEKLDKIVKSAYTV